MYPYSEYKTNPVRMSLTGFVFFILILLLCQSVGFAGTYYRSLEKYKLSNGLTVILNESHDSPLTAMQVWVRTGSCYEGKFLGSGITHLVEHMVFKGEKSGSSKWIAEELQKLGGELDASTSKEYTQFDIIVHSNNLEKALDLVYGVVTKAEFMQEELDREKDVIIREMDTIKDDPNRLMAEEFFKNSFSGHPFGEPVIGNKELFKNITRENLLDYYKSKYVPNNIVLVIAGDFETAKIKPQIEKTWGTIPAAFQAADYIPNKPQVKGHIRNVIDGNKESSYVMAGFYGPSLFSADVYAMDLLAEIAGGNEDSRLVKKIRNELGLVSGISAFSYTPTFTGIWGFSANLTGSDWKAVIKNALKELYKFKTRYVTDEELLTAKKRIIRRCVSSLETVSGRASDLGSNEIYARNPSFTESYIRGIKNVKKENIKKAAQKYFDYEMFTEIILTKKTKVTEETSVSEKSGEIERVELSNGIRVLIKEDNRLPLVNIRLAALGGLLEEDMPGLSYFASQLWLKENQDLVKKIESAGGSISAYSGANSIGCNIEVFKEDADMALDVLNNLMRNRAISKEKMELVRNIQLAQIKQEGDTPYGYAFKLTKQIFFEGHPYKNSILGTEDSVSKISEEDVKTFFDKYFVPGNIVISVFGSQDAREIRRLVENNFGSFEIRPLPEKKQFPKLLQKINAKNEQKEIDQTVIILAYPGTDIYNEDRYAVELLADILSGQAGRLYSAIREKEGLSYSVGAVNQSGREPGALMLYLSTASENADKAKEMLFNEVEKIKSEGVQEEELSRVKKYFITQLEEGWDSVSGLSFEATLDELYGLGWDYYKKYIANIEKVTADDIKNTANKYFKNDWYTLITIGQGEVS